MVNTAQTTPIQFRPKKWFSPINMGHCYIPPSKLTYISMTRRGISMQHLTGFPPIQQGNILWMIPRSYKRHPYQTPTGRYDKTSTKWPQFLRRVRQSNRRTSQCRKDKMLFNGLQMVPRREIVAVRQGSYTYTPITRRRKVNRNTTPQAIIKNIRILDIIGWILQRKYKKTTPNNSILVR